MGFNSLFTPRSVLAIAIPLAVVFIQWILRYAACDSFNGIGITLASIGIGQIFPYIVFEHFLLNKVLSLKEKMTHENNGTILISYKMEGKENLDSIRDIRIIALIVFLANIVLFMMTIVLNLKGETLLHIITGSVSCAITWYYTMRY